MCNHYPELKEYFNAHPKVRHHADVLRNQVRNKGKHAGGVIISDTSLRGRIPVLYDKVTSEDRQIVSAWAEGQDKAELSSVGLVKFDILGLNNLPVIADCIRLIEETTGKRLRRDDIPIDDREAIKIGSKGDLVGIFQLENPKTKPIVDAVKMESLADVAAITSLIRPGPSDMDMDDRYAERKNGEPYDVLDCLKPVLDPTYGIMVYQEQVMRISQVLCGFDSPMANKLRKAMGKKIKSLMDEMKAKFIDGAQPRIDSGEVTKEEVESVFDQIEAFARYGFNKSHAITYSAITTVELWLKYHYRIQYMCALLNNTSQGKEKHGSTNMLVDYINYARRNGIEVLGPDVSKSGQSFTIEDHSIRFSLRHIKYVASQASVIESFQPIKSVEDFYERVKVTTVSKKGRKSSRRPNKKQVEFMVAAGAFDSFGTRNEVMAKYYALRKKKNEEVPQYSDKKWIDKEIEAIGLCLSQPPLYRQYEPLIRKNRWRLASETSSGKRIKVFGRLVAVRNHTSRAGNAMYIATLDDGLDTLSFFVFQASMEYFRDNFRTGMLVAVPLDKFEDSDTRFFDERGDVEIIEEEK